MHRSRLSDIFWGPWMWCEFGCGLDLSLGGDSCHSINRSDTRRPQWMAVIYYLTKNLILNSRCTSPGHQAGSGAPKCGVTVWMWSITMDGTSAMLGHHVYGFWMWIQFRDLLFPTSSHRRDCVHNYISMIDACHMLKLACNPLGDDGIIQSKDGIMRWRCVHQLSEPASRGIGWVDN